MNKTKILFLAAYPDASPLKLDEEIRAITQKIRASEYRDTLELISAWAVRPDDLLQTLNEHKPHIVHFSSHGSPSGEIILVDENLVNGKRVPKAVSPAAIKALFKALKDNVRVVLLNACYSQIQAEAIKDIIDCVIGMNSAIGDPAAIAFAASFYRAIGFGRSVQEAFEQGKVALLLEGIPEENTPELLHRSEIDPTTVFLIGAGSDRHSKPVSVEVSRHPGNRQPEIVSRKVTPSPTRLAHFVTNLEYLDFVQSSRHRRPRHWNPSDPYFPDHQGDAPVTGVSWVDAVAYCDWTGGCLLGTDAGELPMGDIPEIGEWRDAGDEWQKQVCNPHTSHLIEVVNRETPRKNVGFRCAPVRPVPLRKWVFIDGGPCRLGTDVTKFRHLADIHRLPFALRQPILMRQVRLYNVPGYKISATCVTSDEYYEFTQAVGRKWPCHWDAEWLGRSNRPFPARLASQPVVNVSAEDAQAYCIWSHTRLPIWLEWERAASGPATQPYPWGIDYSAAHCNSVESGRGSLASVDEFPLGDSPEGVRQLCGNIAEWVLGPDGQFELRGGSYLMPCELWGLAYAFRQVEFGFYAPDVGFRVVID